MTRTRMLLIFVVVLVGAFAWHASARVGQGGGAPTSVCGDVNGYGRPDITDPIYTLSFLFTGGPAPAPCLAQSGFHAAEVAFDPSGSGLSSTNVQAALLELAAQNAALSARVQALEAITPGAQEVHIDLV